MLELVTGTRRRQSWGDRCNAISGWQRMASAFFWGSLGSCITMIVIAIAQLTSPVPPVNLLDPLIEHHAEQYTVYVLRMEWRGIVKACRLVVYHDRQTWSLSCDPR